MTEKKDEGCCSTTGSSGSCCNGKKTLVMVALGILIFAAGIVFANSKCAMGGAAKTCPMGSMQK